MRTKLSWRTITYGLSDSNLYTYRMCMDSSCDLNGVPMTSSSSCYIFNQQMPNVQRWVRRDFVWILPCKALYTWNILFTYIISFNPHNNSDTQSKLLSLFYKDYRKLLTKDHTDEWQKWPWHLGYWVMCLHVYVYSLQCCDRKMVHFAWLGDIWKLGHLFQGRQYQ